MVENILKEIDNLIIKEKYNEANFALDSLLNNTNELAEVYYKKSIVISWIESKEEALLWIKKALAIENANLTYLFTQSRWYLDCYHFELAVDSLSKMIEVEIELKEDYFLETCYFFRAIAYYQLKMNEQTLSDLSNVRDGFSLFIIGRIYSKKELLTFL